MCGGGGEDGVPDHWVGGGHCADLYLGGLTTSPYHVNVNFVCREDIAVDLSLSVPCYSVLLRSLEALAHMNC